MPPAQGNHGPLQTLIRRYGDDCRRSTTRSQASTKAAEGCPATGQQQQRTCANTFFDVSPFVIPQDPMAAVRKPHAAGQTTKGHTEMLADPIEKTAQGRLALGPELFIRQPCRSSEQSALTEGLPFLLLRAARARARTALPPSDYHPPGEPAAGRPPTRPLQQPGRDLRQPPTQRREKAVLADPPGAGPAPPAIA